MQRNPEQARSSAEQALSLAARGDDNAELVARARAMLALADASTASANSA